MPSSPLRRIWLVTAFAAAIVAVPHITVAQEVISDEARAHFKAGIAYLKDPEGQRYEDAFAEFKKAYELSHSPKVLGNLGLCAMKLERDGEAIDDYSRYLTQVTDIDARERSQIVHDLETLRTSIATVKIAADQQSATVVDARLPAAGPSITNLYELTGGRIELRVRPGHHMMHLRIAGRDVASWEFTVEPSDQLAHTFEQTSDAAPAARPSARGPDRTLPILVMGVGAAALATGGVLGLSALQKTNNLESECKNDVCPANGDLSTARTFVTATDITLLAGALVAAGGFVWFLLSRPSGVVEQSAQRAEIGGVCMKSGCITTFGIGF